MKRRPPNYELHFGEQGLTWRREIPRKLVSVRLDEELLKFAATIGDSKPSYGIRLALYREQQRQNQADTAKPAPRRRAAPKKNKKPKPTKKPRTKGKIKRQSPKRHRVRRA